MYIGFLTNRYGPATTNRLGGSNGAGVPRPITMNVAMHHSARTAPLAPTTTAAICAAPRLAGRTIPDHESSRAGRNTSRKPMKRVEYVSARMRTNVAASYAGVLSRLRKVTHAVKASVARLPQSAPSLASQSPSTMPSARK